MTSEAGVVRSTAIIVQLTAMLWMRWCVEDLYLLLPVAGRRAIQEYNALIIN